MEYRNIFENLKFINIVNFFCDDRLKSRWAEHAGNPEF